MGKHANITAARDRYASLKRCLEKPSVYARYCSGRDRERRTKCNATFLHQAKDFRRSTVAVLDRFNSRKCCAPHSLGRRCVRADRNVRALRRFDHELQFVE